jgi:Fe-S cluster assembly scaffold protein SufB
MKSSDLMVEFLNFLEEEGYKKRFLAYAVSPLKNINKWSVMEYFAWDSTDEDPKQWSELDDKWRERYIRLEEEEEEYKEFIKKSLARVEEEKLEKRRKDSFMRKVAVLYDKTFGSKVEG